MRFLIDYAKATTTKASRAAFVMESTLETNGMSDVNLAMPLMKQTKKTFLNAFYYLRTVGKLLQAAQLL